MKKLFFLLCLLPILAATGFAQEEGARQDVNLSFMGTIQPYVEGSNTTGVGSGTTYVQQHSTLGTGMLLGYRYLLTPNGAIEGNYSYSRFTNKFTSNRPDNARIPTSMQEATFAYVRTFPFKKFNPFIEGGGGLLFFSPNGGASLTTLDTHMTKALTVLVGGGVAYQLSPSWDLRVQYRAQIFSATNFGLPRYSLGRRYVVSQPAIGFSYHF